MNNHIFPFLWLKGESQEIIADYIRQIHESHIGAICIESRPHPGFLGPKWWADVEMIIAELKKYNMKLWILDDAHFPTGYAGGAIKQNPRLGKKLLIHRRIQILGPKNRPESIPSYPETKMHAFWGSWQNKEPPRLI